MTQLKLVSPPPGSLPWAPFYFLLLLFHPHLGLVPLWAPRLWSYYCLAHQCPSLIAFFGPFLTHCELPGQGPCLAHPWVRSTQHRIWHHLVLRDWMNEPCSSRGFFLELYKEHTINICSSSFWNYPGWVQVFLSLDSGLTEARTSQSLIFLSKHLSRFACESCSLSILSLCYGIMTTALSAPWPSIWLFVDLLRGTGKLASRPVRLKGWALFFLAKKRKPFTDPGPPRVLQGLRDLWPGLSKLMWIAGQGKRKPWSGFMLCFPDWKVSLGFPPSSSLEALIQLCFFS